MERQRQTETERIKLSNFLKKFLCHYSLNNCFIMSITLSLDTSF